MNVFPFIEAEKAEQHDTVKRSCELLEVSRSAFYEWHQHSPCGSPADVARTGEHSVIHDASRGTYGSPRVHSAFVRWPSRREHVRGLSATKAWWAGAGDGGSRPLIRSDGIRGAILAVVRAGTVDSTASTCGDITYIRTWEGWLYLATVIDLASRRVVGWAMADHLRADLVDALCARPSPGSAGHWCVFHSDRGPNTRATSSPTCSPITR